ncbi:MAG TPA: ABC transporter substrate-binding protein [Methylomirabilota bacterium]|nr:ABC transporter substrate-binding protein [Methylomirabilota bacterium]
MRKRFWQPKESGLNAGVRAIGWCVLVAAVWWHQPAIAGVPTDQVRGTIDRVLAILQDPKLKAADKLKERRELLSKVIAARFDFAEMARRSLGAQWRRLTPAQQREFVALFTDLLSDAYVADIESYKGEKVIYARETQEDRYAAVSTLLKSPEGAEYTIEYRLHLVDKEWKVYDVVIENVSIVNNYRSQFARVINKSSYEGLLRALREKAVSKQS